MDDDYDEKDDHRDFQDYHQNEYYDDYHIVGNGIALLAMMLFQHSTIMLRDDDFENVDSVDDVADVNEGDDDDVEDVNEVDKQSCYGCFRANPVIAC